jgi:Ser-tRNA(Ala) deacylase AlaX
MLETAEERVKLLKKGFTQKQIEELYIEGNDLRMANPPILIELVEINERQNKKTCVNCEAAVEYAQSLCAEMANVCDISKISGIMSANGAVKTKT